MRENPAKMRAVGDHLESHWRHAQKDERKVCLLVARQMKKRMLEIEKHSKSFKDDGVGWEPCRRMLGTSA